jgi:hypothetical protein
MAAVRIQRKTPIIQYVGEEADSAVHPPRQRRADFVNVDFQGISGPAHLAAADRQYGRGAAHPQLAALSHRPALRILAVQGDVKRAVIVGVRISAPPCPSVVGGEDAANESDESQRVRAIIAHCIDVPPCIATGLDRAIETESAIIAAAASRPDIAVMGIPGPGCVLPPARYKPWIRLRAPARLKEDIHPWEAGP